MQAIKKIYNDSDFYSIINNEKVISENGLSLIEFYSDERILVTTNQQNCVRHQFIENDEFEGEHLYYDLKYDFNSPIVVEILKIHNK